MMARELLLWAAADSVRNNWPSIAIDRNSLLERSATIFLELKTRVLVATARSATGCSVPGDVESTNSAKVVAPLTVGTASLLLVEDSCQLDVDS